MNCILLYAIGVALNFGVPMLGFGKSFYEYDKEHPILWFLNIIVCLLLPFFLALSYTTHIIADKFLK